MFGRAVARGVRDATRRPGLVALLWAWNLALAGLVTLPFWVWIYGASSVSPVTDALLDGFDLGVISELIAADARVAQTLFASVGTLVLLALLSGAFVSGGILEVLTSEGDGRPLLHRFFRGAGHFFGRFVRLLVIAGVTALPVVAIVAAALNAATRPLASGGSERAALWGTIAVQAGVGLTVAWFMLALDYARAATVWSGSRSMFRTWLRSLAFVVRRAPGVAAIGLLSALLVSAAFAVTVAYDVAANGRTWFLILGTVLVHEAMLLLRTAVRVGQVSAQASYWKGLQPVLVETPQPGTPLPVVPPVQVEPPAVEPAPQPEPQPAEQG